MAEFSKADLRYFEEARKEATKSNYRRIHLGTVIVYQGHIIGRGHNSTKTSPTQARYNKYRKFKYTSAKQTLDMLHSEISALQSVPYTVDQETNWSKVKVYTYRISVGHGGRGLSRPCAGCRQALVDKGVKNLYYTGDDSFIYERIGE